MRTDVTLRALRDASPRNQPGFEESIALYDALRERITATAVPTRRPLPALVFRRRVVGLSAAVAVLTVVGVIAGLTVSATSPPSAYAAAKRALSATAAAVSGTMTLTATGPGGTVSTLDTTRWNGDSIAISSGPRHLLGRNQQLLLIAGAAYVQTADGSWVHYASAADTGPTLTVGVELAHDNVAGSTAEQILSLATGLQKVVRPGGSTVYTGTIPNNITDFPGTTTTDDSIMRMIDSLRVGNQPGDPGGYHNGLQLTMTVTSTGLVRQISLTFQQRGTNIRAGKATTWSVTYSQLGSTPPIGAPAASTPGGAQ